MRPKARLLIGEGAVPGCSTDQHVCPIMLDQHRGRIGQAPRWYAGRGYTPQLPTHGGHRPQRKPAHR